jgi:hypothetical protein
MVDAAKEEINMELICMVETTVPIVIEDPVNRCSELTLIEDKLDAARDDTNIVLPTIDDIWKDDTFNNDDTVMEEPVREDILVLSVCTEEADKKDPRTELTIKEDACNNVDTSNGADRMEDADNDDVCRLLMSIELVWKIGKPNVVVLPMFVVIEDPTKEDTDIEANNIVDASNDEKPRVFVVIEEIIAEDTSTVLVSNVLTNKPT